MGKRASGSRGGKCCASLTACVKSPGDGRKHLLRQSMNLAEPGPLDRVQAAITRSTAYRRHVRSPNAMQQWQAAV